MTHSFLECTPKIFQVHLQFLILPQPSIQSPDNSDCILGPTTMENSCNITEAAHKLYHIGVWERQLQPKVIQHQIYYGWCTKAYFCDCLSFLIVIVNSLRTVHEESCFPLSIWTQRRVNVMGLLAVKHHCRPNKNIRHRDGKYSIVSHKIQLRNSCSCQTQEADKKYCILFG